MWVSLGRGVWGISCPATGKAAEGMGKSDRAENSGLGLDEGQDFVLHLRSALAVEQLVAAFLQ